LAGDFSRGTNKLNEGYCAEVLGNVFAAKHCGDFQAVALPVSQRTKRMKRGFANALHVPIKLKLFVRPKKSVFRVIPGDCGASKFLWANTPISPVVIKHNQIAE